MMHMALQGRTLKQVLLLQVQRLLIMLAEAGLVCPAKLLKASLARSAASAPFVLAWLRCLHPQLKLPSLRPEASGALKTLACCCCYCRGGA